METCGMSREYCVTFQIPYADGDGTYEKHYLRRFCGHYIDADVWEYRRSEPRIGGICPFCRPARPVVSTP